jgi:hypothetical protein
VKNHADTLKGRVEAKTITAGSCGLKGVIEKEQSYQKNQVDNGCHSRLAFQIVLITLLEEKMNKKINQAVA